MVGAVIGVTVRPAHFIPADRRFIHVRGIPIAGQAASEVPAPFDALVAVPVQHVHDNPFITGFMLVLRIQQRRWRYPDQ